MIDQEVNKIRDKVIVLTERIDELTRKVDVLCDIITNLKEKEKKAATKARDHAVTPVTKPKRQSYT